MQPNQPKIRRLKRRISAPSLQILIMLIHIILVCVMIDCSERRGGRSHLGAVQCMQNLNGVKQGKDPKVFNAMPMGWDNILLDLSRIRGHADGKWEDDTMWQPVCPGLGDGVWCPMVGSGQLSWARWPGPAAGAGHQELTTLGSSQRDSDSRSWLRLTATSRETQIWPASALGPSLAQLTTQSHPTLFRGH